MDYQLEPKQIVDYPRCRIYREFIRSLMKDRDIRTDAMCHLAWQAPQSGCFRNRQSFGIRRFSTISTFQLSQEVIHYFYLDSSFDFFHYIPDDAAGITMLRPLCSPSLQKALRSLLLSDLQPPCPNYGLEHDAVSDGIPLLLAFDFDMLRLSRFRTALSFHGLTGSLICFDFQKPTLQQYFGDAAIIDTISLKKFEGRFLH